MQRYAPLLILVAAAAAIFGSFAYFDQAGVKEAAAFAAQVQGKTLAVSATYVNDIPDHSQKITIRNVRPYIDRSEVKLTGVLTIDPSTPGCTIAAITKMEESAISLSWNCNGTFPTPQSFKGLRLDPDPAGPIPFWWNYSIVPTGATTP